MLDHKSTFDGTFHERCIEEALPHTLLQFVAMLEHGADIKSQLRFGASKTIAQLFQYNCYAKYKEGGATHRHSKNRETIPCLHGDGCLCKDLKAKVEEMLNEHGISTSYDWVLEIFAQLGQQLVSTWKMGWSVHQFRKKGCLPHQPT